MKKIITIGRQFGSGGREVGQKGIESLVIGIPAVRLPQKPQRDPALTVCFRFQTAQRDQTQQSGRHVMLRGA